MHSNARGSFLSQSPADFVPVTMHGSITVRLYYEAHHATFIIEDTGVGIPQEGTVLVSIDFNTYLNYIPTARHRQGFPTVSPRFCA